METKELASKIEVAIPGSVLETRPFGRGNALSIWIEMQSLVKVGRWLAGSSGGCFDWLENLSAIDIDGTIVFTFFLYSRSSGRMLILRGSVVPSSPSKTVSIPSIVSVWPMAREFEREIADLFGVEFEGGAKPGGGTLPEGWDGFPLRKSYVFPSEFMDILHMRQVGRGVGSMGTGE